MYNICVHYDKLKNVAKRNHAAKRALPYFERHLKKNPDDQNRRMHYAIFLASSDAVKKACKLLKIL